MNDNNEPTAESAQASTDTRIIRSGSDGRLRVSPELRAELLEAFDRSGMTAMSFARRHGVKYPTFMSWLSKRRREAPERGDQPGVGFAEVLGTQRPGAPLRVELPGGVSMEIATRAALPLAAELLGLLRARC